MNKILCAMSGGVDSAVAALLLKKAGYDVTGITLLLSNNCSDAVDAKAICECLGIGHITLDLQKEFIELVEKPFCESYIAGETPNPCIICNKRIKFGLLYSEAKRLGFEKIATGHYAKKKLLGSHYAICRAADEKKDQSYMLWQLSSEQISATEFPLGDLNKTEIRKIAEAHGFPNAKRRDSQDICFVPNGDYASFVEELTGFKSTSGDYLDRFGKVIGKHKGTLHYTVGQRKGLGVAFGETMYVLAKDASSNTVTLGSDDLLFKREITVNSVNLCPSASLTGKHSVKIRYAHTPASAEVLRIDDTHLKIVFDQPQRAPAKGQSAVIYRDDVLLGGGFID